MMQGKIEANLSAGSQMTIWGQPRTSAELYDSDVGYRRMYRCFFAMDMVGREDGAQPWRASRETDRRRHTEGNRLKKEVWQYWPHSLRLITREQLGFRNLFLGVANLHYSGAKGS
jgi:hypothetical protein